MNWVMNYSLGGVPQGRQSICPIDSIHPILADPEQADLSDLLIILIDARSDYFWIILKIFSDFSLRDYIKAVRHRF